MSYTLLVGIIPWDSKHTPECGSMPSIDVQCLKPQNMSSHAARALFPLFKSNALAESYAHHKCTQHHYPNDHSASCICNKCGCLAFVHQSAS